jgi:hypothetical protein
LSSGKKESASRGEQVGKGEVGAKAAFDGMREEKERSLPPSVLSGTSTADQQEVGSDPTEKTLPAISVKEEEQLEQALLESSKLAAKEPAAGIDEEEELKKAIKESERDARLESLARARE